MKIIVTKDKVKIEEFNVIHEGEHKVNKCSFSFSEDFTEDLVKKAIFTLQNDSIEVPIINNECDIPTEILKARNIVLLGIYAYKVTEDKLDLRYSPSPDAFKVISGSYVEDASESEEITATQFEQYMQALNDGLNKVEASLQEMDQATTSATNLVDEINKKLENGDFVGPQGPQGVPGKDGTDGIGITTITSGQSTIEDDKTVTPVTVQKTDGSSESFNVEAKNGTDGKDGLNGKDGVNGQNGQDGITPNIQIGTVETLEPNEHATVTRTGTDEQPVFNFGIPKGEKGNPGEVTEETLDKLIPKDTASDEIVSIDDALSYKTFNVTVDGASEQITTTGKNLFDTSSLLQTSTVIGTSVGNIYTLKPNTQYTISTNMVSNPNSTNGIDPMIGDPQNNNAYVFVSTDINIEDVTSNNQGVGTLSNKTKTITTDSTGNLYIGLRGGFTDEFNTLVGQGGYIQIEEGSTATSYEPYTGGQPSPNPNYPQEITTLNFDKITRCGKNLLPNNLTAQTINGISVIVNDDKSITVNGTAEKRTVFYLYSRNTNEIDYILPKGIDFILKSPRLYNVGINFQLGLYEPNKKEEYITANGNNDRQFKLDNYKILNYFALIVEEGQTVNFTCYPQLEIGTQSTNYEPYQGQTYDIDLQGERFIGVNGVGDQLVIDKYGNYYKNELFDIIYNITGDEEVIYITDNTYPYFVIKKKSYYPPHTLCNIAKNVETIANMMKPENNNSFFLNSGSLGFRFDNITSIDDFKAKIKSLNSSGHQVCVIQIGNRTLEPTKKNLGTLSELITTLNGTNNISINGNIPTTISTTYALDIKKYIDNKLAEISNAIIEEG